MTDEYLRRNLLHAQAVGVYFGIVSIISRLNKTKRRPQWLVDTLIHEGHKLSLVCNEMANHRDEVKA